ncbi:hypothetical protein BD769DRAFT_1660236 [Suillus cothurnatus]|nr:hypothetical protein BD769DRAFT_1660236 [Suillus cothurnatus]
MRIQERVVTGISMFHHDFLIASGTFFAYPVALLVKVISMKPSQEAELYCRLFLVDAFWQYRAPYSGGSISFIWRGAQTTSEFNITPCFPPLRFAGVLDSAMMLTKGFNHTVRTDVSTELDNMDSKESW